MAISITTSDIKRKCAISSADTEWDSDISSLISEMQGAIEETILDTHLQNTGNTNLQKALKLGIMELIAAEMINRREGEAEEFKAGGVSIKARAANGEQLRRCGDARLAPYRKPAFAPSVTTVVVDDESWE
jgi:hypothetical protein